MLTEKQKSNIRFTMGVARDCGITITPNDALEHFTNIMNNLPEGTNENCSGVFEATKEYFTG